MTLVQSFNHQYLQILFSNVIRDDLNLERIIFQRQYERSIIIILHCAYINNLTEININNIIKSLISIFANYQIFLYFFVDAKRMDRMDWKASQPIDNFLHKELQWSSRSKIVFFMETGLI